MKIIPALAALLFTFAVLHALNVNIVMKDGSVVKGNMLGKTADVIYLDAGGGKVKEMKVADIKALFDAAEGSEIDLTKTGNAEQNQSGQTNGSGSPVITVVPGTDVYYANYNGDILYYYGGFWWRYIGGVWYRADIYTGPWAIIEPDIVPYPVIYIGPRWYFWPHRFFWGWHGWHGWHGGHRWR